MSEEIVSGGCLCGAVRYQARGRPTVSMVCHCQTCARAAGAPAVPWVTFPVAAFAFVAGNPAEFRSSAPVVRTFCSACGTPLTYRHTDRMSEIDVTTRTLDTPEAFPPSYHAWESHKVSWFECPTGVPRYEQGTPE
jgi:hypothetical protein